MEYNAYAATISQYGSGNDAIARRLICIALFSSTPYIKVMRLVQK